MDFDFSEWLNKQLDQRGWSQGELARRAGISQGAISNVLSGKREPGADFCMKVAQALGEAPEKVLKLAGILPASEAEIREIRTEEMLAIYRTMTPGQKKEVWRFIKFLLQSREDKENGET
jgi:transcriptional regulator with XRE-family HTH domain